jgi:hypothetical protein
VNGSRDQHCRKQKKELPEAGSHHAVPPLGTYLKTVNSPSL